MANCQKYNKATLGHMFKHYERAKDEDGNYIKFGNQSIDLNRTHLNYNLGPEREINQGEFIKQRCSEVYCLNRKDVNVMASWVVTAPQDLPTRELEQFFKASYEFMAERYGRENVISSYVHMDEVTPHMHFAFVPVVHDKKKDRLKVSAKDVINRQELQVFHGELQDYVEQVLGHKVAILNEATKNGNKSIAELKAETALEAQISLSKARSEEQTYISKAEALEMEYGAIKGFLRADNSTLPKQMYPADVQVIEKGLLKKEKYVQVPQAMWEALWKSADTEMRAYKAINQLEKSMSVFQDKLKENNSYWKNVVEELRYKNRQLEEKNGQLHSLLKKSNAELRELKKNFDETMRWVNSDKSITESYNEYREKLKLEQNQSKNRKNRIEIEVDNKFYFDNRPPRSNGRGFER